MEVEKRIEGESSISSPANESSKIKTREADVVVHASTPLPLPFGIEEKKDEVIFVDPSCGEGKRILADPDTTVSELFAVLRQFITPVCNNIKLIIDEMLRRNVGPNDIDSTTGLTMMHYVIRAESVCSKKQSLKSALQTLLLHDADALQPSLFTEMNGLHFAAYFDAVQSAEILINYMEDKRQSKYFINDLCSGFEYGSSLHIAAACSSVDVAELLIAHGANISLKDDQGRIPESCIPSNIHAETVIKANKMKRLLNDMNCNSKSAKLSEKRSSKSQRDSSTNCKKTSNCRFSVGDHVIVAGSNSGVIRFIGNTEFTSGLWCGIELDEPAGRNDGSINGRRYFSCPPTNGVFAQPNKLRMRNIT